MARAKKAVEDKPMSNRRTKEQREFASYIVDDIIPYFESQLDYVYPLMQRASEKEELSREEWNNIKDIVRKIADMHGDNVYLSYDMNNIESNNYRTKHTVHYDVVSSKHARFFINQVDKSKKFDKSDEKEGKFYINCMYVACLHMYYYIVAPEKL